MFWGCVNDNLWWALLHHHLQPWDLVWQQKSTGSCQMDAAGSCADQILALHQQRIFLLRQIFELLQGIRWLILSRISKCRLCSMEHQWLNAWICQFMLQAYSELVSSWIGRNFTLRYTGGMVPDVHHILAKGGGVFCNPASAAAPAKLRLVYETAPLAFILEVYSWHLLGTTALRLRSQYGLPILWYPMLSYPMISIPCCLMI